MSRPGREGLLLRLRVPARVENLKDLRRAVREAAAGSGCAREVVEAVVLAVDEACQNIVRHAYPPSAAGGAIEVEMRREDGNLVIRLADDAPPIDPARIRPRDLDDVRPGGLGTHFIYSLMDEVSYGRPPGGDGNLLVMKKRID
jgi:sigma-B regulation protein RsbU (phosphoserine phosphatase)